MNRNETTALREQRTKIHSLMTAELVKEQTSETRAKISRMLGDIDALSMQINKIENPAYVPSVDFGRYDANEGQRMAAFARFLRTGVETMSTEQRKWLRVENRDGLVEGDQIAHIGTYTGLGFFVPTGFMNRVDDALKYYADLLNDGVCNVIETATGQALPFPVSDDTSNQAVVVGESNDVSEEDVTANHVKLGAYKLSAGVVKCSVELMQDSAFDLEGWLAERFGIRYGRGLEHYLTVGSGVGEPTGILTAIAASGATPVTAAGSAANDGVTANDGTNSIGYQDLVNLEHSVDPSYRKGARYMFNDKVLGHIKTRLDKFGRPIWVPGVAVNAPDTVLGYPYVINQAMSSIAPGNTTAAFGDFSKFVIRKVKSMTMQRLVELYAVKRQIGFISDMRVDSNLVTQGRALNVLIQHT